MTTTSRGPFRTVLISGASSGIGQATALRLASEGWRVFAGVRQQADAPLTPPCVTGLIEAVLLDVTDPASVASARAHVDERLAGNGLTALVNNAGIGSLAPMQSVPIDDLQAIFDVNVFGMVRLTQAFLPLMKSGSRLIVIGSVGDRLTMPFGGPLTSSKWAVASIAEALRLELRGRPIPVTIVEPGSIHSDAVEKVEDKATVTAAQVAVTDPELAKRVERATKVAIAYESNGSNPEVVAAAISRSLNSAHPKTRLLVGKHARALAAMATLLPDVLFDPLRLRVFHDQEPRT